MAAKEIAKGAKALIADSVANLRYRKVSAFEEISSSGQPPAGGVLMWRLTEGSLEQAQQVGRRKAGDSANIGESDFSRQVRIDEIPGSAESTILLDSSRAAHRRENFCLSQNARVDIE